MIYSHACKILVVDDNAAIHADFRKILARPSSDAAFEELDRMTFGAPSPATKSPDIVCDLDYAFQGIEAYERVQAAVHANQPYALAFVDMRMPPGWDGIETVEHLWKVDPGLQIVICSAYADYDWNDVLGRLNRPDKLLVIKKPFEAVEVLQCANALTGKWRGEKELRQHLASLEGLIRERTASVEAMNEQLREEMRRRQTAEVELGLAQKLEAVGRLAAGIAHEINTPIQYIGDSIHFLSSAFSDLLKVVSSFESTPGYVVDANVLFLRDEIPRAIERTIDGTERVASIVRAMKEFAHPGGNEMAFADINRALETTVLIARNEYKYVASVELQCGDISEVMCNVGELGQVFLNLIVNAAHALAEAGRDPQTGRITICTRSVGEWTEITFEDNGCGIGQEIIDKIYDPFFTTKEVGRGTGQGLAIARSIIVDKHGGRIDVSSSPGVYTCFTVRLPTHAAERAPADP